MNNAGNLIDACYLATIFSLLDFKLPLVKVKQGQKLEIMSKGAKKVLQGLSIHHIPVLVTFIFLDDGKIFAIDPLLEEEEI